MENVKATRKQHRRLFTIACNSFESEETTLSEQEKILKLKLIEDKAKLLIACEEEFKKLLFQEVESEEVIEKEIDESEVYLDRWRILEMKLMHLQTPNKNYSVIHDVTGVQNTSNALLHYPKIKLPTFDGNVRNWLCFWGQFKKIDSDQNLDEHDKFAYLSQAMEKGSPADDLLRSFPPGGKSYAKAIKQLQTRFGKEELLIEVYVRDLLSLVLKKQNTNKNHSLRKLYDQLESRLRALETLGVAREKYAAMLFPLVESSLPDDVLRAWERYRSAYRRSKDEVTSEDEQKVVDKHKSDLDNILCFLQDEVEGEERITLAVQCFDSAKSGRFSKHKNSMSKLEESSIVPSAADLLTSSQGSRKVCIFCANPHHNSGDCYRARKMSLKEKQVAIEKAHCCFLCLRSGHEVKKCKTKIGCLVCGKRHHVLLCRNINQNQGHDSSEKKEELKEPPTQQDETLANLSKSPNVMLQTLTVTLRGRGHTRTARAIIDSASQRSYILKSTAREMGYEPAGDEYLRHSLFGGANSGICKHDIFTVYLANVSRTYYCNFKALSQPVICETMPPICQGLSLQELSDCDIQITDNRDGPIEILIGADVAGKLMTGGYRQMTSGLSAIETKLGWTVMGRTPQSSSDENSALLVTSMLNKNACISDLWTLDSLGITDPSEQKTKFELHEAAKQHFVNTVKVENKRFVVHLPWIEDHAPLPDNYELALRRLNSTINKIKAEGLYEDYKNIFEDWLKEGIIEEVPTSEVNAPCHYLPHRPVVKENSTTRVRPVFDASAKQKGCPSLNECLEKGLNLIELIPSVLTRFRLNQIGVVADIRKAFLQIGLFLKDRNFLRFLWKDDMDNVKLFRHCRVVFGTSCSPFLLGVAIQYHLQSAFESNERKYSIYSEVIQKLMNSFYVDNCVSSVRNETELHDFMKIATNIMSERKFELRGWEYTDPSLVCETPTNVLGMLWNRSNDMLRVNVGNLKDICLEKISKRIILALAHKVFDPLGITCPALLTPKLLLQRMWKTKINWDQEVDSKTKNEFMKWVKEMPYLENLEVPRWIRSGSLKEISSLHVFCDASRLAYAAAIFIRVETENSVKVQLVQARSRVSPCGKKDTTIARLELLGATIASRLASSIVKEFHTDEIYYWTDSTTVLTWIKRAEAWGIFVHNRVEEIRNLTRVEDWRFVPGTMNPADLPSRGCSAQLLSTSRWWEGPSWLYLPALEWPNTELDVNEEEVASERKQKIVSSLVNFGINSSPISTRFSSYKKTVRVVAWIHRFCYNCRNPGKKKGELAVPELVMAENRIIRLVQLESFEGITDKRLKTLNPFYDEEIIKMKTGVFRRVDAEEFRTPIILPGEHPIVKNLIMEEHEVNGHVGVSHTLNTLRERFWLICGRRSVRSVIRTCVICRRHSGKHVNPPTAPPPADRVQDAAVFQVTGVDFAGPIILRDKRKAWICLFTCAVYRAIHLELVTSLSTEAFLQAFHRFVARRGKPTTVYSDNGTNFKGAANVLASIDFDQVSRKTSEESITWKFIPPGAPWWGGWWERLVGMVKQMLKKILRRASLSYEEMLTTLCNCEAILNERPLTAVTSEVDLSAITPASFLKEIKVYQVPDVNLTSDANNLRRRLLYIQSVREAFRKRFRQEYLGALKTRQKNFKISDVKTGDIVLVGDEDKKRLLWPLGRIIELLPGADGISRRARVKTQKGELIRALQSLYPLEVSSEIANTQLKRDEKVFNKVKQANDRVHAPHSTTVTGKPITTRLGRRVRPPEKLTL